MQNKSVPKSWTDIQMIISSIAIAITLGLWSLFSGPQKKNASVTGEMIVPPQTSTVNTTVVTQPQLVPGQKLLLGGTAPKQKVVVVNGGGGGGGGGVAPASGGGGGGTGGGTGTS